MSILSLVHGVTARSMRRAVSGSGLGFMSLIDRRIGVFFLSEAVGAFIAFGKGARANLFLLSGEIG